MVFGNMGDDSGTGVAFTRDPNTGEKVLFGEYLTNAQGEDVVAGIRTAPTIAQMATEMPAVYAEFQRIGQQLEQHYRDVQDLEFTIERGKLYMLQTRDRPSGPLRRPCGSPRTWWQEGLITKEEAINRVEPAHVDQLLRDQFDPVALAAAKRVAKGLNASPGAAVGRAVFDADVAVEWVGRGEQVVLVRIETSPDDFHGMAVAQGILTARGGATSHAAVVARQIGKPCVAGCAELRRRLRAPDVPAARSPGSSSARATGSASMARPGRSTWARCPRWPPASRTRPTSSSILGWADEIRRMGVWTNADKPEEAARARSYGAQGIGLCRTEHMFREGDRLEIVRGAILIANQATRAKARGRLPARRPTPTDAALIADFDAAMAKLEVLQQGDFEGIFTAMDGLPVVIRLIDPPLHEFLPNLEEQLVKVTKAGDAATAGGPASCSRPSSRCTSRTPCWACAAAVWASMIPDFVKIQTRAILNAQIAVTKAGRQAHRQDR